MNVTLGMVVIGILAIIGGLWMFAKRMRQVGEATISAEVAEETVDKLRKAGDAQVNAPQSKPDVVKRLREKGL